MADETVTVDELILRSLASAGCPLLANEVFPANRRPAAPMSVDGVRSRLHALADRRPPLVVKEWGRTAGRKRDGWLWSITDDGRQVLADLEKNRA